MLFSMQRLITRRAFHSRITAMLRVKKVANVSRIHLIGLAARLLNKFHRNPENSRRKGVTVVVKFKVARQEIGTNFCC